MRLSALASRLPAWRVSLPAGRGLFNRHADVPLDRDPSARFLPWLIAFMVYLAILALTAALFMGRVADRWDQGLSGRLTVQIPPVDGQDAAEAATQEQRIDAVLEVLTATPGVETASLLGHEEIAALLAPWLGEGVMEQGLPLPALVAVTLARGTPPDLRPLAERLDVVAPGTTVDDHQRWLGNLLDLAGTIALLAHLLVIAVGATGTVAVIFVTRTGLALHRQVIELLHLIGAQDAYVARQFQAHALRLGLGGGLIGFLLAALTIALVGHFLQRLDTALIPRLSLGFGDWLSLALIPFIAAAVAMVTARLTVLRTLSRLP